ncbi:nucleoid-associated protein [Tenacibaculum maritimum]|nr:nucleoid-associated protein [Tenacibaculum maritimum]MDB0602096.1 nucleoid-associated protein [Tenacibaculum maritimum]
MIKRTRAEISKLIIHKVANKFNSGNNSFSDEVVRFDEESYDAMRNFLLKPFSGLTQSYRFSHNADVRLNQLNETTSEMFTDESFFVENSRVIVEHLYQQSNSAQIKTGDVLVVFFEGIEYKDILTEAIGVFKIENKANFFQTYQENENFDVALVKGISTNKLDKGCLILNTSDTEGTVVLSVTIIITMHNIGLKIS